MAGFATKYYTENQKIIHNSVKTYDIFETKSSWKLMISFCYLQKKLSFILGMAHAGPVFA